MGLRAICRLIPLDENMQAYVTIVRSRLQALWMCVRMVEP